MKAVVFDFNRTLYDPEVDELMPGAEKILKKLTDAGAVLFLVGKGKEERKKRIESLGLSQYFKRIIVNERKGSDDYQTCIDELPEGTEFFAVGDRIKEEITHANACGMTTIWFRNGKFADEEPKNERETPSRIASSLSEVPRIVLGR